MTTLHASPPRPRRSLIPWLFPAALLPVLAANAALIYLAIESKPALVSEHPFEDGRTYNRELEAAAKQTVLGWTATLEAPRTANVADRIVFAVLDSADAPITGLVVALRIWRPVGSEGDLRVALVEVAPGRYAAPMTIPEPGQWQFDIVATRGDEEFVLGKRIVVQ